MTRNIVWLLVPVVVQVPAVAPSAQAAAGARKQAEVRDTIELPPRFFLASREILPLSRSAAAIRARLGVPKAQHVFLRTAPVKDGVWPVALQVETGRRGGRLVGQTLARSKWKRVGGRWRPVKRRGRTWQLATPR